MKFIVRPDATPLISFRIAFRTGSADDPQGKAGCAALLSTMLTQGGSRTRPYPEILDALFPMAASFRAQVDKELITFSGETHVANLDAYYELLHDSILDPGWREEDFDRNREDLVNGITVGLRSSNDEELAKEAMYAEIYRDHPYGRYNGGSVSSLQSLTMEDLREFYTRHFSRANLIIAFGGGLPEGFVDRIKQDFSRLPEGRRQALALPQPRALTRSEALLIEKDSRSVAISFGYPIDLTRASEDYLPLLVAQSYFGQHRMGGRLFDQIRETRGLNYGDYAYLEYFPFGMYLLQPLPNHPRSQQIFQVWIRPVEFDAARFAIRLAVHELQGLIENGIPPEDYERTVLFLGKYVRLLTKNKTSELGYAIDSEIYGTPEFGEYVRKGLETMTRDRVNEAVRKHLRADRLQLTTVGPNAVEFAEELASGIVKPPQYPTPKPAEVLREDEEVCRQPETWDRDAIRVVPVDEVFA